MQNNDLSKAQPQDFLFNVQLKRPPQMANYIYPS